MIRHSTGTSAPHSARWYLSILGNVALWSIIAIDAWFLWPSSLGGGTTLVIVNGDSMNPTFHDGDLVIARSGPVEPGDIVIYTPADMGGARVVHRIVGGDAASGWKMQGDNNSWLDQWTPTDDDVLGRVALHFAGAGRLADFLITPWIWGFVLLGALALVVWPESEHEDKEKARRSDAQLSQATTVPEQPARVFRP